MGARHKGSMPLPLYQLTLVKLRFEMPGEDSIDIVSKRFTIPSHI